MSELSHPYEILDVFTDRPLEGNPLAVFTAGEQIPSRLLQAAARELHLSETVFLLPGDGDADAGVRIFTPQAELPFAGHPVLGAAFVVGESRGLSTVRLRTGAGVVPVTLTREDGVVVHGEMQQPVPSIHGFEHERELLAALGVSEPVLPVELYRNGPEHVMVGLAGARQLAELAPDMAALARLGQIGVDCFASAQEPPAAMTVAAGGHTRVRCRVFCPGMGVPEDPATGSAAGPLAVHLARHGWCPPGTELTILQGAEIQRPSRLIARIEGDPEHPRLVCVGGGAVRVAHGHYRLQ